MKFIDDFLNSITMYRLVLYYLIVLLVVAAVYSILGFLPFSLPALVFSTLFLLTVGLLTNTIFAKAYSAPTNVESVYISSLILALIITPISSVSGLAFLFWAAVLTMASKYIIAHSYKHLFNPVALGVALTSFGINQSATWWVSNHLLAPIVLIGGLLIVRKIRRFDLIYGFFMAAGISIFALSLLRGLDPLSNLQKIVLEFPLLFFAFVMLTEPTTIPPTKNLQMLYGGLVGFLINPQVHLGPLFSTPELSLLVGNIFSYTVSFKQKLILRLKEKVQIAPDVYDFVFSLNKPINFTPGQYLEWTLPGDHTDSRGNRRYFTIASSPTESDLRIGVKFHPQPSTYKQMMQSLDSHTEIIAGSMGGDFVLPKNSSQKLVFIAGGIGITPFRSILKYLTDTHQKRDIIVFYSNKTPAEIVYKDVLEASRVPIKYIFTESGVRLNSDIIKSEVPDYPDRIFYISGPNSMVDAFKKMLADMKVPAGHLVTDYFPGFA